MSDQTAKKYNLVICVTSGEGYEEGCVYPQIGFNNGVNILRESKAGDVYIGLFQTGGLGRGVFNALDNSGRPSFDPYEEGVKSNNQTAKRDDGKLMLTLVPPEIIEAVAVIRQYGNAKYPNGGVDNWKTVSKERYRNALCRHLIAYLREPYGMDGESNLPHLFHMLCNGAFLCSIEIADGTLPTAQEALKKMHHPEPLQAPRSHEKDKAGETTSESGKTEEKAHRLRWKVYEVANTEEEQPIAWECPNCGEVVETQHNFCPNCGVKLEKAARWKK